MRTQTRSVRRRGAGLAGLAVLAVAGLAGQTAYAGSSAATPATTARHLVDEGFVDATAGVGAGVGAFARADGPQVATRSQVRAVLDSHDTVLDLDPATGTVRFLADLDGHLTGRSSRSAAGIALAYVRRNAAALGLGKPDLTTFRLERDYRDITGTHHLYFVQHVDGETVARNGLTASVDRAGRLLTLGGSPVSRSRIGGPPPASTETVTTPAAALARTRGPEAAHADLGDDSARRVLFATAEGLRPAWETVVTSSATPATTVIDAVTGEVLQRTPLTHYEHSTGRAFRYFPGAARGGRQIRVDFTRRHWLPADAHRLFGNNAHAYSDVNDDDRPSRSEEVHPLRGHSWGYRLTPFDLPFATSFCGNPWPCSWNPDRAYSWRVNRAQNATQVFYYVNNWHDHLLKAPIGFTEAAGNFQLDNRSGHGKGGDPVDVETDDGADTGEGSLTGLPDSHHTDDANMSTPPDGQSPTMQMYLQHAPHTSYPDGDPWSPTNVGDEADTVYHEYTHGLSSRLVVDVRGRVVLGPVQGDSMGEAWSDWYAFDYLVGRHLMVDRPGRADVRLSVYDGAGTRQDRTEPVDCKVGQRAGCPGGHTGHRGGYTYADYASVVGEPEVHGDGEIWAQTLWDLRDRLGSWTSRSLVTRAMELAPYYPSFLDMRNAILVADTAVYDGHHHRAIWKVFAHRGMGFHAGSLGGFDTTPSASFSLPPASIVTGSILGTVTDRESGRPVAGLRVTLAFQGSGAVNPTATTDAQGHYAITGVPQGHYGKLVVQGRRYQARHSVTVGSAPTTVDFTPARHD